jgi:GNAT superfamily N-acetyltransferase
MKIIEFEPQYQDETVRHLLEVQNDEFNLGLTTADQPDLVDIRASYKESGGNFWLALDDNGCVVGTIGLFDLGGKNADLRRMFVKPGFRGKGGAGRLLVEILIRWAGENQFENIYLETNSVFKAAVKFYPKVGFVPIPTASLPSNFPIGKYGEFFFVQKLAESPLT